MHCVSQLRHKNGPTTFRLMYICYAPLWGIAVADGEAVEKFTECLVAAGV